MIGQVNGLVLLIALRPQGEVGDPLETGGLRGAVGQGGAFLAFQDPHRVGLVFGIDVGDIIDPAIVLLDLVLRASVKAQRVFGGQRPEGSELLVEVGDVVLL
ncbi:MAG: hypothetical protein M5U01_29290 [Ardenticatenaceae bacterium]|nr:hypothetical protein [Ardenticatenaceae bacterium]